MAANTQTPIKSKGSRNPFDRFFRNHFLDFWNEDVSDTVPSVNITENDEQYSVEMAAPGLRKEDFNIEMDGNLLTISCEQEHEQKQDGEDKNYWRREYNYSSFSRSLTLPENADHEKINC